DRPDRRRGGAGRGHGCGAAGPGTGRWPGPPHADTTAQAPRPRAPGRGGAPCPHRPGRRPPMTHRFRTEDGMEMRSIERPRRQGIVVWTAALILGAVAAGGTARASGADPRPADERPAVVARIRVAGTPSTVAAGRHAIWVLSAATLYRIDPQ